MLMLKLSCGPHGCYLEGGEGTGQHQACKWVTNSQPSVHLHVHSSCASSYTFPLHTFHIRIQQAAAFSHVYETLQIGHKLWFQPSVWKLSCYTSLPFPCSCFMCIFSIFPLHTLHIRILQAAAFCDVYETLQIGHKLSDSSPFCGSYLTALHCPLRVHASCASSVSFHCTHWTASIRRANGSPTLMVCKLSSCTSHPCQNYLTCIGAWPRKSDATYIMKFLKAFLTSAELKQYHLYTSCYLPESKIWVKPRQPKAT